MDRPIVVDLSFQVKRGEHVFISGPSGVGKSTMLFALMELYTNWVGTVEKLPPEHIMFLSQVYHLAPAFSFSEWLICRQHMPLKNKHKVMVILFFWEFESFLLLPCFLFFHISLLLRTKRTRFQFG